MCEELGKEIAVEAAKAVAVEGYKDTLQPTLKAVGSVIALPFQIIDAALSKPKLWVAEKHYNYERTLRLLAEKLKDTSEELIVPPENYVAVPALQQIAYCFDSDELRDMYANLLANSMNKVVKNGVHPSYVEIIKQLSPDEAKMLRYIYINTYIPTLGLKAYKKNGGYLSFFESFTNITEFCECDDIGGYEKYIDNLIRLGLIIKPEDKYLIDDEKYEPLRNHSFIVEKMRFLKSVDEVSNVEFIKGLLELTAFGKTFCYICLETQNIIDEEKDESRDNHDQL